MIRTLFFALATCCLLGTLDAQVLAPWKSSGEAQRSSISFFDVAAPEVLPQGEWTLMLPTPEGDELSCVMRDGEVLPPALQAKFPGVRTYRGNTELGAAVALTISPRGLYVHVYEPGQPSWGIEPIGATRARLGLTRDLTGERSTAPLSCGYVPDALESQATDLGDADKSTPAQQQRRVAVVKRRYILALATTGEFGERYGPTKPEVVATLARAVNVLNNTTLLEVGAEFQLHPDNDLIIFTDPDTDPYLQTNRGGALLGENPPIINARIPVEEYDLGHVFTLGCVDVGGVVSGRACNDAGKARGVTCHYSRDLTFIVENVMAHEVAHQFAVSHSWNNCPGNQQQRAGAGAYEPGSGSTIMSYQGACGADNNVERIASQDYYHVISLQQFTDFTTSGGGAACADFITTDNDYPEIEWPYADGFAIPQQTPFVLRASATDPNGDDLLYVWEQFDRGPMGIALCDQTDESPLFRSIPPDAEGNERYFPKLSTVRAGRTDCEEQLPRFARELNFRMTVRDRNALAGGTVWEQVTFDVAENTGPFAVTSQSSLATTYAAGQFVQVTWDVAGSNQAPVNCQEVNILLSMDDGRTFDIVLAERTNNDGSEGVTIPQVQGSEARIKVEAADNIFYSLSPSRFTIVEPTEPGFTFVASESTSFLCLPQNAQIDLFTASLLGYEDQLTVEIVNEDDLPAGVVASLDRNTITPGEQVTLDLDFSNFNATDSITLIVEARGPGVDTARRELLFDVVSNDFSDLELIGPADGENNVIEAPIFSFDPSDRAESYVLEVSTSPRFGLGTIVIDDPNPNGEQIFTQLASNTVYFWRVVPSNRCGEAEDVPVNAFSTLAASCTQFRRDEVIIIPPRVRTTREAIIPVTQMGTVNDLNLSEVEVFYSEIKDIKVILEAPTGQEVVLLENRCGGIDRLFTGFDDESPLAFDCVVLPNDGQRRRPVNPLSAFDGVEIQGDWKLKVEVVEPSDGGEFRSFEVEFCANVTSRAPTLDLNTVEVPTGQFQVLDRTYISADDDDNGVADLRFYLMSEPAEGHLELYGRRLILGETWTQAEAQVGGLTYVHDGDMPGTDAFEIVLSDGGGNVVATPVVDVEIGDDFQVSTGELAELEVAMALSPNPSGARTALLFDQPSAGGELRLLDLRGRTLTARRVAVGEQRIDIDASELPAGVYVVSYRGAEGSRTLRLVRR